MNKTMEWYNTRSTNRAGGQFIVRNKFNLYMPDSWLQSTVISEDSELLYLHYTTCTVKIAGYRLSKIHNDATEGKLGTVIAAPAEDKEAIKAAEKSYEPYITSITIWAMNPVGVSDLINKSNA